MFVPHTRLVRNSMPCQLKTLLHQHWSQMKDVVQLFKGKYKYLDLLSILLHMCNIKMQLSVQRWNYWDNLGALVKCVVKWPMFNICKHMIHHMTEWWKSFPMVPHIVYFDILVTIQRQFINVQYRDTSKVENMVLVWGYLYKYSQNS